MTGFQKTMAAFGVTLAAGVAGFSWQSAELHELRKAQGADGGARSGTVAVDAGPVGRQSGRVAVRKATLLERVNAKLLESVKPEDVAGFLAGGYDLARLGVLTKLSEAEKAAFAKALAAYDLERVRVSMNQSLTGEARAAALAEITAREKAWVAERLGPERAGALAEADAAFERTRAGQEAAKAAARVGQAVNLSAEQEARLRAALAERAQHPPEMEPVEGMMIRPFGGVSVDRTAPDLNGEAERILTPEQWAAYTEIKKAQGKASGMKMNWLTTKIMPSFLNAAREVADE